MYQKYIDNWREYTNYPDFWIYNKLYEKSCSLWVLHHQRQDNIKILYDNDNNPYAQDMEYNVNDSIEEHDKKYKRITLDDIKQTNGWAESEYIIIVDQEGLSFTWTTHHPNIYVIDSVFPSSDNRLISFFWWFWMVYEVYKYQHVKLLGYYKKSSTALFDCLLGNVREHRDFVYNKIYSNDIQKYFILNYNGATHSGINIKSWNSGLLRIYRKDNSNFCANQSCFIPKEIYDNSFYSIITETRCDQHFLTEKTAKPLLSKRLFIVFGKQHTLRNLQKIGYQTFGDVIDESYDNIEDDNLRWEMAFAQVIFLINQDPYDIYKAITHVIDHNKQHFIDTYNTTTVESLVMSILDK